jgi:hypothetical protein
MAMSLTQTLGSIAYYAQRISASIKSDTQVLARELRETLVRSAFKSSTSVRP